MKRLHHILLACLLTIALLPAAAQEARFREANERYQQGEYEKAITAYQSIEQQGLESAELYYNLGNAYFKQGDLPHAILYYERAKRLAPGDEDILHNLQLANLNIVDKIEVLPKVFFIEWWQAFVRLLTAESWAILAVISIWLAAFMGVLFWAGTSRAAKRAGFSLGTLFTLLTLLLLLTAYQNYHLTYGMDYGIVFAENVYVKSEPSNTSTDLFLLHEGTKVHIRKKVGNWLEVKLADGQVGWMEEKKLEKI